MLHEANGECGGCHTEPEHEGGEPLSAIGDGCIATSGMFLNEHEDDCPRRTADIDSAAEMECDCETNTYSTSQCEGCGSYLHGERHAMTLFKN
jgi:hypothetical protein